MELPNIHFQDFPVEFKEINSRDFTMKFKNESGKLTKDGFLVDEKIIIDSNEDGFINEALQSKIDIKEENTVVVNASVGSGKSYAIIQTIKRFYDSDEKYLIVVATPFVSLVEQYVNDIHKDAEIPQDQIYNYLSLGRDDVGYINKCVQVVTVNTLLGNPGEEGFKNSDIKRKYLNDLISNCKQKNIKVVFVFDEIHDAIQNFREELIFNIFKWREITHKNFIISATFNEASKVVIEYLAELTHKKIQIIESKRKRIPSKQSKLYLHYSSAHNFSEKTNEIVSVISDLVHRDKQIDILCYSKSLVKDIIKDKDGIGKLLFDTFGEINDCTSQLVSNQRTENEPAKNRYDNSRCNIGTNFKTGVSIKKKNHAFVIIMPPRATKLWFRNKSGIFSDGINSIIQAIARQRKKGEIHIILPRPDAFDYDSLVNAKMNDVQKKAFKESYEKVRHYDEKDVVKYYPLIVQDLLLRSFYEDILLEDVKREIEYSKSSRADYLSRLEFPPYPIFKLDRGEEYLANTVKFFGEDLSAYVTYSAFTNQFVNCNLVGVNYKTDLFFKENEIQKELDRVFNDYFGEPYYDSQTTISNFRMFYNNFRNELFQNFTLRYKKEGGEKWHKINPYNNKNFEKQLLKYVGQKYYGNQYYHKTELSQKYVDSDYVRSEYILDCISISKDIKIDEVDYSDDCKKRIKLYQILNQFRDKLIANTLEYNSSVLSYKYFKNKPSNGLFSQEDKRLFLEVLELIQFDEVLNNEIFEFKRTLNINSFYTRLIDDNFEYEPNRLPVGKRDKIKKIISVKALPDSKYVINLVESSRYEDVQLNGNWIIENFGSFEEYQKNKNFIDSVLEDFFK